MAQFHFPDISSPLKKCLHGKVLLFHQPLHHNSLGTNPNASEGSGFLVTRCSLISGSSAKGCLQAPHSFELIYFPKSPFATNLKLS